MPVRFRPRRLELVLVAALGVGAALDVLQHGRTRNQAPLSEAEEGVPGRGSDDALLRLHERRRSGGAAPRASGVFFAGSPSASGRPTENTRGDRFEPHSLWE